MSFVLDTSILIEIENNNKEIIQKIEQLCPPSNIFITFFSYCEFYFGIIEKSEKNKSKALERLSEYKLINTTEKSAITFCEILHDLKKRGEMIPEFDILIASLVIDNNLTLITSDNDFKKIKELRSIIL